MEINPLNHTFPALSSILPNQNERQGLLVSTPPTIVGSQNINLSNQDAILIQAQNLINDTLQGLNPGTQNEIIFNQTFSNLSADQQLELLAQSNLLLNDALQNLEAGRRDALLISVEALLRQTLENLNNGQNSLPSQSDTLINQTFRNLGSVPSLTTVNETVFQTFETITLPQDQGGSGQNRTINQIAPQQTAPAPQSVTQTAAPEESIPLAVTPQALSSRPAPAEIIPEAPFLIPDINPTPFGVAIYEVGKQKLTTLEPEPAKKEVEPAKPIASTGIIGGLFLRPQWQSQQQGPESPVISREQLPGERLVRSMISHFNEEQVNHDQPLHLVLTQNETGLALDIYDCSDNYACRTVYDTIIDQKDLPTLMENLRHESGFFVNTKR